MIVLHLSSKFSILGNLIEDPTMLVFLSIRSQFILPAINLILWMSEGSIMMTRMILYCSEGLEVPNINFIINLSNDDAQRQPQ